MPRRNLTLQTSVRNIHVWIGLAAGIAFCLTSLSGSLIVFRHDIESRLRPQWTPYSTARPGAAATEAARNIRRRWPDARTVNLEFPARTGEPYEFLIRTPDGGGVHVFADSRSGEVLGTFDVAWLEWIVELHHNLRFENGGKRIVGAIGLALFAASLTGLSLWLVRKPKWKTALRIDSRSSWKRFNFDLHRTSGLLANALLLILSVTGICVAYPQTMASLAGVARIGMTRTAPAVDSASVESQSVEIMPVEALADAARRAIPGSTVRQIRFAENPGQAAIVRLSAPGDLRAEGGNRVSLDPATARVLQVDRQSDRASHWTWLQWLEQSAAPVHYAEWGGLTIRILWSMAGLAPTLLFLSGFFMWWYPWRAKVRAARRAYAASGTPLSGNLKQTTPE